MEEMKMKEIFYIIVLALGAWGGLKYFNNKRQNEEIKSINRKDSREKRTNNRNKMQETVSQQKTPSFKFPWGNEFEPEDMQTQILGLWKIDHISSTGSSVEVEIPINKESGEAFWIGSGSNDNYMIKDDATVSRNHVKISMESGKMILFDNESTNGVRIPLNGEWKQVSEIEIKHGMEVVLGKSRLVFRKNGYNFSNRGKSKSMSKKDFFIEEYESEEKTINNKKKVMKNER